MVMVLCKEKLFYFIFKWDIKATVICEFKDKFLDSLRIVVI